MSEVTVDLIPALAQATDMIGLQIRYATDSGDVRTAHVRGFSGPTANILDTNVRLTDDFSEWFIPLMEFALKIKNGEVALKR